MNRTSKIILGILGGVIALAFLFVFFFNDYLENKIKSSIKKELDQSFIQYSEIDVDVFNRNAAVSKLRFQRGKFNVRAENIQLDAFDYYDYFVNHKITIGKIVLESPDITIEPSDSLPNKRKKADKNFKENITIKNFHLTNGTLKIKDSAKVQGSLYVNLKELQVKGIRVNAGTLKGKLPFEYEHVALQSDTIFFGLDAEHNLSVEGFSFKDDQLNLENIHITPKYSKSEFDRRQKIEKDRMVLGINNVKINNFNWDFINDTLLLQSPKIIVNNANWELYRNKLIADPTTTKPLYSKMLREMGIKLDFGSVKIKNSQIVYEERVHNDRPSALFKFSKIDGSISNLTNVGMHKKDFLDTKLQAKAFFMDEAKISMNLAFNVANLKDEFHVSGDLFNLSAADMNVILKPEMNILAHGQIQSVYYNFYGNDNAAEGETQLKYEDFKIEILRKDGQKKNKLLSGLVNLVVNNKTKNKNLTQPDLRIERDKTKSFWNYFWLCIRAGALKSFI